MRTTQERGKPTGNVRFCSETLLFAREETLRMKQNPFTGTS